MINRFLLGGFAYLWGFLLRRNPCSSTRLALIHVQIVAQIDRGNSTISKYHFLRKIIGNYP